MTVHTTRENWMLDAGKLDDKEVLFLYPCGDLDQAKALAALDAQYGKGSFDAWQHGSALRVARRAFHHHGEAYKRFSDANEYFWAARKEKLPEAEIDRRRQLIAEPRRLWDNLCVRIPKRGAP